MKSIDNIYITTFSSKFDNYICADGKKIVELCDILDRSCLPFSEYIPIITADKRTVKPGDGFKDIEFRYRLKLSIKSKSGCQVALLHLLLN